MKIRVASVAWKIRFVRSDGEYFGHFYDLMNDAHKLGAEVVVLPELMCMELLPLAPDLEEKDVPAYLVQFAEGIEEWLVRIARSSGMTLVGGSHFRHMEGGIVNACVTATPDGHISLTAKNELTGYERGFWRLMAGKGLSRLPDKRFGVLVGQDAQFPDAGRALAAAGAQVIAAPSFCEGREAFETARSACVARAQETGAFVVQSSLVGSLGYGPMESSHGSSAIIADSGVVLVETEPNREGIVVADLEVRSAEATSVEPGPRCPSSWKVS